MRDESTPAERRVRHYALEEITQSLGLASDSPEFSDSIFFEKGSNFGNAVRLSSRYQKLVKLFYTHIKPGARRTEVREAIKKYWNAPIPSRSSTPSMSMPERLEALAKDKWTSLFDEVDDVQSSSVSRRSATLENG